jgi:two-component system NtrC family response regulator
MQARLLRVLESGEIRRVGDNESFLVDVRVVCATHRNLGEMVSEGEFREDLWFRINTFEIDLPALRHRRDDIPALAEYLLRRHMNVLPREEILFSPEALDILTAHQWHGNVRELANVVEHATILCDQLPITPDHLPGRFTETSPRSRPRYGRLTMREIELEAICAAVEHHGGSKPKAAEELQISLKTLYNKLNQAENLGKSA